MDNYKTVKWTPSRSHYISNEQAESLRQQVRAAEEHNARVLREKRDAYNKLMVLTIDVFGHNSRQVRYLRAADIPKPPSYKKVLRDLDNEIAARDRADRERERRADYRLRQEEAIERLESAGFVRGEHFSRSNAITFAKEHLECVSGRYVRRIEPMLEVVP